ncbi:MAG: diphosphate--fructose-6-phosphate 1-phosphotransferase [Verrucomicrobia bacterium]|nr:diphosphate--fructose-6-phosphate 1-phosphotransferase [Verrucomicrobiota bacterium]
MEWESGNELQKARQAYLPSIPHLLRSLSEVQFSPSNEKSDSQDKIKELFPLTSGQPFLQGQQGGSRTSKQLMVGVVLSGGQAAGGHNVIIGIHDALKQLNKQSRIFGFIDGPGGIVAGKSRELTAEILAPYRNTGGFDMIGSGRTKIETQEQLNASLEVVQKMKLDGLVIIGGDDSNTNAAVLAEYFLKNGCSTKVIGVPKTIDGDLKNAYVGTSFGFDTACKIYCEIIGNIARDAQSAKKYYHFIKLMGRSASHIALECALATRPNLALIGEEVAALKKTLTQLTQEIADLICKRAELGKHFGVILIPEGLVEFIPEMSVLIKELNQILLSDASGDISRISSKLTASSQSCFSSLPERIQQQLLLNRDPHGNVQVSLIETERLLMEMVGKELEKRQKEGKCAVKYFPLQHFLGYEGRAGFPSNFDSNYCYALGFTAALLIDEGATGYMASVTDLTKPPQEWGIGGVPLTALMHVEMRKGKEKPVIQKALVELNGKPFARFQRQREQWRLQDEYRYPGPIQFFGAPELTDQVPITLILET